MSENAVRDDDHESPTSGGNASPVQAITPLPKLQILSVSMIQFTEPITALVIYPFINQLIRETGITNGNDARSGYYAGIIVRIKLYFLAELVFNLMFSLTGINLLPFGIVDSCPVGLSFR